MSSLTNKQIEAIESYSSGSTRIQTLLRSGYNINTIPVNRVIETIKVLDTAIKDICSKSFIVYSGLNINIFEKESTVYKAEYISTTSDIEKAKEFIENEAESKQYIYHITIHPGVKFLDFCKYENIPHDEKEILIQRGTYMTLNKKQRNNLYVTLTNKLPVVKSTSNNSSNSNGGAVKRIVKRFTYNGNKYIITETNEGHCIRKNGIYICTKEVRALVKELRGGVIVSLEGDDTSIHIVKRPIYKDFKEFLNKVEIVSTNTVEFQGFPTMKILDSKGNTRIFILKDILQKGAFGETGIMHSNKHPYKFALKRFFDNSENKNLKELKLIEKGRDREIANVNILNNIEGLFESVGTYAKTIVSDDGKSKYILMELAQGDLLDLLDTDIVKNPCNCIKIIYAIFTEIVNIYEKTSPKLLYSDVKLENFLYSHDDNNNLHIIMADYGGLAEENLGLTTKNPDTNIEEPSGISTSFVPSNTKHWENTWKNVAYGLGCSLLYLLNDDSLCTNLQYFKNKADKHRNVVKDSLNKIQDENIKLLLIMLLGEDENGYLNKSDIQDTPQRIDDAFNTLFGEKCGFIRNYKKDEKNDQ
jgi:hypothetical protein